MARDAPLLNIIVYLTYGWILDEVGVFMKYIV